MEITLNMLKAAQDAIWSQIAPDAESIVDGDPPSLVEMCFGADRLYALGYVDTIEASRKYSSAAFGEFNAKLCEHAQTMI